MNGTDPLTAPITGAEHRHIGGIELDIVRAADCRVKRMIYSPGFRWSKDMKSVAGTEVCIHAHVGFLARGQVHVEYTDGCFVDCAAPQVISIEPGHDAWVVGNEAAVRF
jgi:hypothetical protein